ncbi:MAG: DUF2461 domain-containing protein [Ignavibacteriae bacterium]|nr:MAG: DUF2461 domain-containing protein [Ignavibacteriota bacterium]
MLTKEFFTFFAELEKNNSKEWFDAHRAEYEKYVKGPFKNLVQAVIEKIRTVDPVVHMDAKDAIFRINRDIRFSKDKAPYKTNVAANIGRYGKGAMGHPGFYFELNARGGAVGGGSYMPDKEQLAAIRDLIAHEGSDLHKFLKAKAFRDRFGELRGEKNKVLPAEFKQAALVEPLIANKQFYYWAELPKKAVASTDLVNVLFDHYKAAKPVQDFLTQAFE